MGEILLFLAQYPVNSAVETGQVREFDGKVVVDKRGSCMVPGPADEAERV